jgi:hypothetical protein
MEEYYKIMSDLLDTEYEIKAALCVLEVLESTYNEETHFEMKSLITFIKGYLKAVGSNVKKNIDYIDNLTTEKIKNELAAAK